MLHCNMVAVFCLPCNNYIQFLGLCLFALIIFSYDNWILYNCTKIVQNCVEGGGNTILSLSIRSAIKPLKTLRIRLSDWLIVSLDYCCIYAASPCPLSHPHSLNTITPPRHVAPHHHAPYQCIIMGTDTRTIMVHWCIAT